MCAAGRGRGLAGVWVRYQVLEGVSCSECFLLIQRVCVGGCVSSQLKCVCGPGGLPDPGVGRASGVNMVTVTTVMTTVLKHRPRRDESVTLIDGVKPRPLAQASLKPRPLTSEKTMF